MQLIQQLEALGQSGSLKQFGSVEVMLKHFNVNPDLEKNATHLSCDMVCLIEPDDDDDETNA
jgi:hypothetical protein